MNNLPVQMHPRYADFLAFMTECPYRKTPSTMETAFWAWSKKMSELCGERWLETGSPFMSDKEQIEKLKADLDRLHRERDSFQQQARVLAEEVERLNGLFLAGFNHAVGERAEACLSIDGGNL